ncbi:MAG TPA: hypothetical protein VLV18_11425 [Terriglobales bacterium]|nr:hypothetical protein [Terriglobales bacterium]
MKTRYYLLLILTILLPLAEVAASSGTVFAQEACSVAANTTYVSYGANAYASTSSNNVQLSIPVSMTCPYASRTLWAVGSLYNAATNANLGNSSYALNVKGNYYSGALRFTLPASALGQPMQVSISIYNSNSNGQYSGLVTARTVPIGYPSNYGNYAYYGSYPYYYNYPYYGYTYYGYPYGGSCSYQWYNGYGYGYPYYGCAYPYPYGYSHYP